MKNKKYYSGVSYKRKNITGAVAVITGIISVCLIALIIWTVATFSKGENEAFKNQSTQISELKIENEMLRRENEDLKTEIEKYKNGEYDKVDEEPLTTVNPKKEAEKDKDSYNVGSSEKESVKKDYSSEKEEKMQENDSGEKNGSDGYSNRENENDDSSEENV